MIEEWDGNVLTGASSMIGGRKEKNEKLVDHENEKEEKSRRSVHCR